MAQKTIKFSLDSVIKKTSLPSSTFEALVSAVNKLYPETSGQGFRMFYVDEGDKIDVSNDADVETMLADESVNSPKVFVELREPLPVEQKIVVEKVIEKVQVPEPESSSNEVGVYPAVVSKEVEISEEPVIEVVEGQDETPIPEIVRIEEEPKPAAPKPKKEEISAEERDFLEIARVISSKQGKVTDTQTENFLNFVLEHPGVYPDRPLKRLVILSAKNELIGLDALEETELVQLQTDKAALEAKKLAKKPSTSSPNTANPSLPNLPFNLEEMAKEVTGGGGCQDIPKYFRLGHSLMAQRRGQPISESDLKELDEIVKNDPKAFMVVPRVRHAFLEYKATKTELNAEEKKELEGVRPPPEAFGPLGPFMEMANQFRGRCGMMGPRRGGSRKCSKGVKRPKQPKAEPQPEFNFNKDVLDVYEGFVCDGCSVSPIKGTRYTSTVLPDFDFCEVCYLENKEANGEENFKAVVAPIKSTKPDEIVIDLDPSNMEAGLKFVQDLMGKHMGQTEVEIQTGNSKPHTQTQTETNRPHPPPPHMFGSMGMGGHVPPHMRGQFPPPPPPHMRPPQMKGAEGACAFPPPPPPHMRGQMPPPPPFGMMGMMGPVIEDLKASGIDLKDVAQMAAPLIAQCAAAGTPRTNASNTNPMASSQAMATSTVVESQISQVPEVAPEGINGALLRVISSHPPKPSSSDKSIYKTVIVKNTGSVQWDKNCVMGPVQEWIKMDSVKLPALKPGEEGVLTVTVPNLGFPAFHVDVGFFYGKASYGQSGKLSVSNQ